MAVDLELPFSPIFPGAASPFQLFIGASILLFIVYVEQRIRHGRRLHLPPGPRPLPVFGNLFDIPKAFSARKYRELSNQYGDIVHLHVLGQHIIVLGSLEAATELLDTRSAKYSGRPHSTMSEMIRMDQNVALLTYGETWRKHRREIRKFFGITAAARWNDVQESSARKLLALLLEDPQDFMEHVEFAFSYISLRVTYGISPKDRHDEVVALIIEGATIATQALIPGKYQVESIPMLKYIPPWFPGAGFQRDVAKWRRTWSLVRNKAFDDCIAEMCRGSFERHSVVTAMVREAEAKGTLSPEDDDLARDVSAAIYLGGADTTMSTIQIFLLAMALNPEAQKRAHIELDAVIGPDRLPSLSDRGSLPYVEALVMECHRWHPILPLSLVRTYTGEEDDEYNGYRIPKGSLVLANSWAFAHDPQNYPEPEAFMPERYLTGEGQLNHDVRDPRTFTFGYGRRVCPGKHFGDTAVWITVASVLHTFNIRPPLNEKGETVAPNPKFKEGVVSAPEDFQCRITPRSDRAEALIRQNAA